MESINTLLILLLSVAIVVVVVACVVIFNRRGQAQSAADEARRKAAAARQRRELEQEAMRRAEYEKRQQAERHRLEEEAQRAEEELRRNEEESKRLNEDTQRKAEAQRQTEELQRADEDRGHREADEAQRKEEERQVPGEEDRRAEGGGKRLEEKTTRKAGELQPEVESTRKPLEPGKRGGRPRAATHDREKQPLQGGKPRRSKPEIVCWKRERQWIPGVEVPEDLLANSGLAVLQNTLPLTQDELREGCWCLKEACGQVVVQWIEDEVAKEIKVVLGEECYLLFKLSGQDQKQGRHVKSPSLGSYLVMVPDNWERDYALSGPPPAVPEPVSVAGYKAHFFDLEKDGDGKIVFHRPRDKALKIEPRISRFELVGTPLNDASEYVGPLFGDKPPKIRALDNQGWKDVGTIVVGEEGSGIGRWRKQFTPVLGKTEQDLPCEVADRKGGWFFLRFYDTNNDLIESLDFRFICSLKAIEILQPSPLPSEDGHRPVCVEFLHEPCCAVQAADGLQTIQVNSQDDKTTLTIPPDLTYDETRWLVGPVGGPQVEVTILVERLWWGIGEEHNAPSKWEDQLLTLPREHFAATSKKALWLRLPRRRWVDKVLVGFEQPKARRYDVKVTGNTIAIPLRDFGDSKEVEDTMEDHSFKVWIEHDVRFMEGVVAVIPALQLVIAPGPIQVLSPPTPYSVGFGRKKTGVAVAVLQSGSGEMKINGQPIGRYFSGAPLRAREFLRRLLELDRVHVTLSQLDARITVTGSSPTTTRQAKAVAHALARALMNYDSTLKPLLKRAGFGGVRLRNVPTMEQEE